MHRYRAFGLDIASEVRLDELTTGAQGALPPDLTIRYSKLGYDIKALGEAAPSVHWDDPRGVTMIWPGAAAVRIAGPDLIEVEPHPEVLANYLPFPLLGPVMGWLLHVRKTYVLHASAVSLAEHSVVFMGDKLAGKSTTASAFLRAGGQLLTDDLLAFDTQTDGPPLIQPAFAQLKLSDEAGETVQPPGSTPLPLVIEGFEKKQFRLDSMREVAAPCDAIFVLERGGDDARIEWFEGSAALSSLLRYSYMVRFSNAPAQMQDRHRHFEQAALLSRSTRVGALHIPADLERLQETVDFVKQTITAQKN